jgi:hypothetical protein
MELVNANDENSFDPTPKLKSSPVPILFVSFNRSDENCIHCGENYTSTLIYGQKYCKKCLSCYLTKITDNSMYLDVYLLTENLECSRHEISRKKVLQNIQECCRNCLMISCFKQIPTNSYLQFNSEKYCKLCGKILYQGTDLDILRQFKSCSNCYIISSGRIESTLTKNIIYLPWWENRTLCYCHEKLVFTSNSQKYCENCFTFFIGCRYCLTTNVIFGITNQSQCKKCKRISNIIFDITKTIDINSGNCVLDDFLISIRSQSYQSKITNFADYVKNIDRYFNPVRVCYPLYNIIGTEKLMKYIPYSQFTNVKKITEGGFSIVYQAILLGRNFVSVILKRFKTPQYAEKYLISEVDTLLFRIYFI